MGRRPCCPKEINKGAWSREEDETLSKYVAIHGEGKWQKVAQNAGLKRCGKSCRQRWLNYLKPGIKRGDISVDEEDMIIRLHRLLGNRWALIAKRLPGRTDNEIKNYWNTNLSKKLQKQSTTPSTWPPSSSIQHNEKFKQEKTKQIHVTPETPRPMRVKVVKYNTILENNDYEGNPSPSKKIIDHCSDDDEDSLTDYLIDFYQDQVADDDGDSNTNNSKMLQIHQDHNKVVGSTNSPISSSSPSHHFQLSSKKFDPTLLEIELKKMASFLGLENE